MEKIFQVSEFNEYIGLYLKQTGEVTVEGEISEYKPYQAKWLYLTVKDESANLNVFAVTYNIAGWQSLEVGMKVQITGVPGLHQKSGKFSLNANKIIPAGEGALKLAYEKLRLQLEKEGIFDQLRKRSIPQFPQTVGLITALGSDAYNDVVKVLKARFGGIKIKFFPVQVQGTSAPESIIKVFEYCNTHPELQLDCLILTRGGGSLEDLQAFNNEHVVRAVFGSKVPVICGIGHEKDISLCDLAADLRASTPSNAAELLVKHRDEYLSAVNHQIVRLIHAIEVAISDKKYHLQRHLSSIERASSQPKKLFDIYLNRLHNAANQIKYQITNKKQQTDNQKEKIWTAMQNDMAKLITKADSLSRLVKNFDYEETLKRGFSLLRDDAGKIIRSINEVEVGQSISLQISDGRIRSTVKDKSTLT